MYLQQGFSMDIHVICKLYGKRVKNSVYAVSTIYSITLSVFYDVSV